MSYAQEPVPSSGGFRFKGKTATGQNYVFERNSEYFEKDKPKIPVVRLQIFPNESSHLVQLVNDIINFDPYILPVQIPPLKNDPDFELMDYAASEHDFFTLNFNNPILKIREVRQALNYAFNRPEILDAFYYGDGELMSGPLPPDHYGCSIDVLPYEFNPERAKNLLESIGMRDNNEMEYGNGRGKKFN